MPDETRSLDPALTARVVGEWRLKPDMRLFDAMQGVSFIVDAIFLAMISRVRSVPQNLPSVLPYRAPIAMQAKQFDLKLEFLVGDLAYTAFDGKPIKEVFVRITHCVSIKPPPQEEPDAPGTMSMRFRVTPATFANVIKPIYVDFFERHKPWIKSRFGGDANAWPDLLNFARMMRNWISHHHGHVHFENQNAPNVRWRHLTYGPADMGRRIVEGDDGDLDMTDIIILMFDMAAELDLLGCPKDPH